MPNYGGRDTAVRLNDLIPKVKLVLTVNTTKPDILIVHVGGNDTGRRPILDLMRVYEQTFVALITLLPGVQVGFPKYYAKTHGGTHV